MVDMSVHQNFPFVLWIEEPLVAWAVLSSTVAFVVISEFLDGRPVAHFGGRLVTVLMYAGLRLPWRSVLSRVAVLVTA